MTSDPYKEDCPAEVADAIISILRQAILLIRQAGNADDADWCAVEANHVHNLPTLLQIYNRAKLERYLAWAQTGYAHDFQERFQRGPTIYVEQWQRLETFRKNTA